MISSLENILFAFPVFLHGRSSKFSSPNHQCFFEQSSLLQIKDQSGHWFIYLPAFINKSHINSKACIRTMTIPTPIKQLHKANTFLYQFSCQQNIICKTGNIWFCAIHFMNIIRLIIYIHDFRHRDLHAICHFILRNTGKYLRIFIFFIFFFVDLINGINRCFTKITIHSFRIFNK